jgi:hypothetical protein
MRVRLAVEGHDWSGIWDSLLLGAWLDTASFYGAAGLEFDQPAARPFPR